MTRLRDKAKDLFLVACQAADPALALRAALSDTPLPRPDPGGAYIVVSIGKAAVPMAAELLNALDENLVRALVITNYENARELPGTTIMAAGHPVPDENGAKAALAVESLLGTGTAKDRVIALISGGGSALLPAPVAGLSLSDKAEVNRLLLAGGVEINEINLIRQQLSRLKGGGLLRAAAPAPVSAFILSDVIGDDLRAIASGPTVSPIGTRGHARQLLIDRGLWPNLPAAVRAHLNMPEAAVDPLPSANNRLIGSNRKSLEAMANAANANIVSDHLVGDVSAAADVIIKAATAAKKGQPACLIFGGETTVMLKGTGLGGRNQELALRVAMGMPDLGRDWVFLSGGTDGRDGPTEAAGGIVDAQTVPMIRATGADPSALLANNDSHAALKAAGALLITGGTGTNVADVQILLLGV
ncbi:MAG: DUF4147 domain-containing protein [Albidovulum sp.]